MVKSIIKNGLQRTEKEEWKGQYSPDSRIGTLQSSESGYPEDRQPLRNHLKIPQEVNNSICEALHCPSPAEVQLQVKIGQLGNISLSLCKNCVCKFGNEKP
jgi:hypothetical protein